MKKQQQTTSKNNVKKTELKALSCIRQVSNQKTHIFTALFHQLHQWKTMSIFDFLNVVWMLILMVLLPFEARLYFPRYKIKLINLKMTDSLQVMYIPIRLSI